jgi:hypothetical protein
MRLSRIMHKQTDLLNSISNVGSGEDEILKGSSKAAILTGISNRGTIGS